jgi:acetolactate synthase-1/2/3 large subunit
MTRRCADLLIDCLVAHGVPRIFCVPGESFLSVLDALHQRDEIATITCRHESGAALMALTHAKLSATAGVAFVSRGPGATNASIGVHLAEQDASALVLFVGHVPRHEIGRDAFQEVDYAKTFADLAKWVAVVHDPERLPEIVAQAFAIALSPTPGPVIVVLPEDVLDEPTTAAVVAPRPLLGIGSAPTIAAAIAPLVAGAERPLLVVGGAFASADARAVLEQAADVLRLPVVLTFKRQDQFPNRHPLYGGHLGFKIARDQVAIGTRLGEVSTQGYSFPLAPHPRQTLVHVHDDPQVPGRVIAAHHPVLADPVAFLAALAASDAAAALPAVSGVRDGWIKRIHGYVSARRPWQPPPDGSLDMGAVVAALGECLDEDAVLITDAGNFSGWLHRHFAFSGRHQLVGAVGGAMGLAMPAAVASGLLYPQRQVVTLVGDGGFLMTGSELATAIQYGVPVKVFVCNNGSYGTIRMHQERSYPGRNHGTDLHNPDFAALARAYGATGMRIESVADALPVTREALASPGPVVVEVMCALERISAFSTIADLQRSARS